MIVQSFIIIISIIIMMTCLAVSPTEPRKQYISKDLNEEENNVSEIINDFEKTLQKEIKESFESPNSQIPLGWSVYQSGPFNNISTHYNRDPVFYVKKIYRKPYMWPNTFKSTYPIEHQSTLDPKY